MKIKMTLVVLLLTTVIGYGQFIANASNLRTADEFAIVEVTLSHQSMQNFEDVALMGNEQVVLPTQLNGMKLKMEIRRLRTALGYAYELNDTVYQSVILFYDNETMNPRDDVYLANVSFPLQGEFVPDDVIEISQSTSPY